MQDAYHLKLLKCLKTIVPFAVQKNLYVKNIV